MTRLPVRRAAIVVALATVTLAGCGIADPYAESSTDRPPARADRAVGPAPPAGPAPGCSQSVACLARAYARAQGNYTPAGYLAAHRRMVALAVDPLRDQLTRTPPRVIAAGLRDTGVSASSRVLASTVERSSTTGAAVVVAVRQVVRSGSELGRAGAEYLYFRATLRRVSAGWRVTTFEPIR